MILEKTKTKSKALKNSFGKKCFYGAMISVTHSGISPKASIDWAAVVYALMYSLAVFCTWHSYRKNAFVFFFFLVVV